MQSFFIKLVLMGVSNVLNKIIIPIISIILYFNFSGSQYGAWSVYISVIPIVIFLIDFGLTKGFQRYFYENLNIKKKNFYFVNYLYLRIVAYIFTLIILAIIMSFLWDLSSLSYFRKYPYLILILILSLSETHIGLIVSFFRLEKNFLYIVFIRFFQFFFSISLTIFISKYYGVLGAILAFSFVSIILSMLLTLNFLNIYKINIYNYLRKAKLRNSASVFKYSFPFFINDFCFTLRSIGLTFVISFFLPLQIVGNFHIASIFASIITLVIVSIDMVISTYYYEFRKKEKNLKKVDLRIKLFSNIIICVISVLTIIFSTLISSLFGLFYPDKDSLINILILLLTTGLYFQAFSIMWLKPCYYTRNNHYLPILSFTITVLFISGIYFLIPIYGIVIPAVLLLLSNALYAFLVLLLSKKYESTGLEFKIYIPSIIIVIFSSYLNFLFLENLIHIIFFMPLIIILVFFTIFSLMMPKYSKIKNLLKVTGFFKILKNKRSYLDL